LLAVPGIGPGAVPLLQVMAAKQYRCRNIVDEAPSPGHARTKPGRRQPNGCRGAVLAPARFMTALMAGAALVPGYSINTDAIGVLGLVFLAAYAVELYRYREPSWPRRTGKTDHLPRALLAHGIRGLPHGAGYLLPVALKKV